MIVGDRLGSVALRSGPPSPGSRSELEERSQVSSTPRTLRLRRIPRLLIAALAVVPIAILLSSCGKSGLAAQFKGHQVTVTQLQSAYTSLKHADPTGFAQVTQAQVLSAFILAPYAEAAASAAGKGVSDDMVRSAIVSGAQQNGAAVSAKAVGELNADALTVLRGSVAMGQLDATQQAAVIAQIKAAHVKISPRYGTFDPATVAVNPTTPNWIQPTATPTATATATPTAP